MIKRLFLTNRYQ